MFLLAKNTQLFDRRRLGRFKKPYFDQMQAASTLFLEGCLSY